MAKKQATAPQKTAVKKESSKQAPRFQVPFTKRNYILFGIGVAVLLIGYWCMWQPPHNSFLSLTLAPILLVLSYCVIFPYAIMAREKTASVGG